MKSLFSISKLWNKNNTASATEYINAFAVFVFFILWGIALLTFAVSFGGQNFFVLFSKILVVSAAGYFCGGLTGFLFGIPKSLQNPDRASNNPSVQGQSGIQNLFFTNTSLEQISDWLTKIVVGVTLVNLKAVPGYLENLRSWLQFIFPGPDSSSTSAYALALIIFSAIMGFITFYIYTRVNLAAQFIKEAIDNNQLTNDVVKKADNDPQFKTNLLNQLK